MWVCELISVFLYEGLFDDVQCWEMWVDAGEVGEGDEMTKSSGIDSRANQKLEANLPVVLLERVSVLDSLWQIRV